MRILEGYGLTEASPVLAVNTLAHPRRGTVGRFLPGIAWRLDPLPGIDAGGRLLVRGANVMLGYLRASAPGVIEPPAGGWLDTGDIATVDDLGFVTITGRVRRFAEIGGEMVSMAMAEAVVLSLWPGEVHAVISMPDPHKGETLLLVTTCQAADLDMLRRHARACGVAEISVPVAALSVESMPLMVNGSIDYPAVARLAASHARRTANAIFAEAADAGGTT